MANNVAQWPQEPTGAAQNTGIHQGGVVSEDTVLIFETELEKYLVCHMFALKNS